MASLKRPTISVVMAAYNGERYIKKQIDSILKQLNDKDELIISLDPSTDTTQQIIERYNDSRIKLIHGPGIGLIKNFENGLRQAKNDVIFLSDQDDLWKENKVEVILKSLNNNLLILHDCEVIDQNGNVIEPSFMTYRHSKNGRFQNILRNSFIGCCMAFKKDLLPFVLPFPDRIPMHDQWIGLIALKKGRVLFLKEPLVQYRRHDTNESNMDHASFTQMLLWRWRLIKALFTRRYL